MSEFVKKKYITFRYVDAPNGGCWEGREHWEGRGLGSTYDAYVCRIHHYQTTVWVCEVAYGLCLTAGLLQDIVDFMNEIKEKTK